jgi:hypothetical protein
MVRTQRIARAFGCPVAPDGPPGNYRCNPPSGNALTADKSGRKALKDRWHNCGCRADCIGISRRQRLCISELSDLRPKRRCAHVDDRLQKIQVHVKGLQKLPGAVRWLVHPHHADDLRRRISPERLDNATSPIRWRVEQATLCIRLSRPRASDIRAQGPVQHGQRQGVERP